MPENFTTKPTDAEKAAIESCNDPRHLYELLQAKVAAERLIAPETSAPAVAAEPSMPAGPVYHRASGYYRVVYPNNNDRFEVTADSEEELQKKIERIHQMYKR